jgi:hypothetical protein
MTNPVHLPVEDRMKSAANTVKPSQQFSDELWRKMQANQAAAPARFSFSRPLKIAALSLAVLGLLIIAIGPKQVWASVNQLIGYLPGIGFFRNDGQTLYLAEPVSTQQGGVTMTVKQAVADKDLLVIDYEITGLKAMMPDGTWSCMYDSNEVVLPDGSKKHVTGGDSAGEADGLRSRVEFPALPKTVKQITLVAAMIEQDPTCKAPAELRIDLPLVTAPTGISSALVNEFPSAEPNGDSTSSTPVTSNSASGIKFNIDRMAEMPEGYVISGHATDENKDWQNIWPEFDRMKITDAKGAKVDFEQANEVSGENEFGIQINGKNYEFPLKITIPSVLVTGSPEQAPSFQMNAGENPQIGQEFQIHQDVEVLGQKVTFVSAKAVQDKANADHNSGFEFTVQYDGSVKFINLGLKDPGEYAQGHGSARPNGDNSQILEYYFSKGLPKGELTFQVHTIQFGLEDNWDIQINSAQ